MSTPIPPAAPVVVVGAGVIGLAVAFELASRGRRPLVLERAVPGAGASGVSAGMLAVSAEAEYEDDPLVRAGLESLELYPDFVRRVEAASGLACGLRTEGTLLAAFTQDQEEDLRHLARRQARLGLRCTWLEGPAVREREPQLAPRVRGALLAERDWQVDPRLLVAALVGALPRLGGQVVSGARVTGLETRGGRLARVVGVAGDGSAGATAFAVECEAAVLAAGAWCDVELARPGPPLGVRPVKGQVVRLRGPELLRQVVITPHVYLVPRAGGELVVGATMEEQGFDPWPTAGAVSDLLWNARLALPAVADLVLAEVAVGFRPAARDERPLIGETSTPGLYVATGHFRHGVLLAPVTARWLAELMAEGRRPPALEAFRPERAAATRGAA